MIMTLICLILMIADKHRIIKPFDLDATLPLRGLLAILIVCHHIGQKSAGYIPGLSCIFVSMGLQIVAVFFFISGYGLFVSYKKKGEKYLQGFLKKRYSKILPVFLVLSILCIFIDLYNGHSLTHLFHRYSSGVTPLPYSWFIYAIIYVYAAFYLSALIGKNITRTGVIFTAFLFLYIIIIRFIVGFPQYWYITILCTSAGYFTAYFERDIEEYLSSHRYIFFSSVIAFLFLSFCAMCKIIVISQELTTLWLIAQAFSVYVIVRILGFINWKILALVGGFSLELYLVHGIWLIYILPHLNIFSGVALYIVALICAIPSAWVIHKICFR